MSRSDVTRTKVLSAAFAEHRVRAEVQLWEAMGAAGLRREDGWSIVEFTREDDAGTQLVLRPLHLSKPTPANLQCIVEIIDDGSIATQCAAPDS